MNDATGLPIVDALALPDAHRRVLRPDTLMRTSGGAVHRLPRFFYAIESAQVAVQTQLTPHFALWEFVEVDLHEPAVLRSYPRYVPCAVTALATALEVLRIEAGLPIRIAANGGYRSPGHTRSASGSPHCWGAAANIYRIGTEYLDTEEKVDKYAALVSRVLPGCWTRPSGREQGCADDHLHIDLGYVTVVPHGLSERTVD